MDTEENDPPQVTSFFSKRAKFVPQITTEEFEATAKLLEEKSDVVLQPTKVKTKRKVPAKGKNLEPLQGTVDDKDSVEDIVSSSEEVCLSASAKRRLRKLQLEHDRELKRIQAESQSVLSISTSEINEEVLDEGSDDFDKINVLTISYLSDLSRLTCHENDKFSTIFPKVAELFHLKVSEFLLCHREHNIKVDDTPKSLKIAETDILECIPYKADSIPQNDLDEDRLKLFFQSSDSKRKTEIFVHKLEKFEDVMQKYADTSDIPIDELIFEFDGERIDGSETPEDMDMESGSCIDVRVLTANKTTVDGGRKRNSTKATNSATNKTAGSRAAENCVDLIDSASDKTNGSRGSRESSIDLTATDNAAVSRDSEDIVDLTASTSNNNVTTVSDAESENCTLVKVVKTANKKAPGRKRGRKANAKKTLPRRTSPRKKKNSTSSVITVGSESNDSIVLCE